MTEYDVGDVAHLTAEFVDLNGDAIDPTAVTLLYRPPIGELMTLLYGIDEEIIRDAAGKYHADIEIDIAGKWGYRWASTGTGQAAEEGSFFARSQTVK